MVLKLTSEDEKAVKGRLTSGGVVTFGDRRSMVGLEGTERGERSTERREFWRGEGESVSDLAIPLLGLTLGVAGDALLGVSDLFQFQSCKL